MIEEVSPWVLLYALPLLIMLILGSQGQEERKVPEAPKTSPDTHPERYGAYIQLAGKRYN